jgi:hypothetical protein
MNNLVHFADWLLTVRSLYRGFSNRKLVKSGRTGSGCGLMRAMVMGTDVVSYIYKKDTRAAKYEPHFVNAITSISFMTLAKLERWAIARNWGARRHVVFARR